MSQAREQSARSRCRRENVQGGQGRGMQGPLRSVQCGQGPGGLVLLWTGGMHVFRHRQSKVDGGGGCGPGAHGVPAGPLAALALLRALFLPSPGPRGGCG